MKKLKIEHKNRLKVFENQQDIEPTTQKAYNRYGIRSKECFKKQQETLYEEYSVNVKEVKRMIAKSDKAINIESLAKEAETAPSKGELDTVYNITK